jgi:hypothetical protein
MGGWADQYDDILEAPARRLRHLPSPSVEVIRGGIMNAGLCIGIIGIFAILFFQEWFFGAPDIDDEQGFPRSRNRKSKRERNK